MSGKSPYTEDDVKKWVAMRDKGYSLKAIARKYRAFWGTVSKKIKAYEANLATEEAEEPSTVGEEASPAGEEEDSLLYEVEETLSFDPWERSSKRRLEKEFSNSIRAMPQKRGNDLEKDFDFSDLIKLKKQLMIINILTDSPNEGKGSGIDLNKIITLSFFEKLLR